MTSTPLGIRQNNPGNIRIIPRVTFEGQAPIQPGDEFCRFYEAKFGIRAIFRVLITYADARLARDGSRIDTIREVIDRWAPANENDTNAYARHVASRLAVAPDDALEIKRPDIAYDLVESIILHENGMQPYSRAQIEAGMVLAGIEPERKPLTQSRTVKGGQVAGAAGTVATVTGIVSQIQPALPVVEWMRDNFSLALIVLGIAALAGVGYMLWARLDDRRKGLR